MNKTISLLLLMLACFSAGAQNFVGSIERAKKDISLFCPSEFLFSNNVVLGVGSFHPNRYDICVYDSIVLYNSDLEVSATLVPPSVTYTYIDYRDYLDHFGEWHYDTLRAFEDLSGQLLLDYNKIGEDGVEFKFWYTQTLFNNDSKYEFVLLHYDGDEFVYLNDLLTTRYHTSRASGLDILNEDGEEVTTIRCAANESMTGFVGVYKWDEKYFLAAEVRQLQADETLSRVTHFYRIDRQTQKIEQVASVPFSVRPTVMERGQEIVVELDEGSNAREIEVVNGMGQTVKRVPVAAGQREVRINSADMGSGMNFISTRTTEGQGTVKIIVR